MNAKEQKQKEQITTREVVSKNVSYVLTAYAKGVRNFEAIDLTGADFSYKNLQGVSFYDANLTGANFEGADLTGARISIANVQLIVVVSKNIDG